MSAQNTDKLRKVSRKWVGSIGSGGVADELIDTIPLASTANLTTETAVMVTIDRVDANGVLTSDKEEGIIGVVSSNSLIDCLRGVEGTAQAHSAGAVVEVLWTAKNVNDIVDAILAEHSQSGAHTTDTISEKTAAAGVTVDGVKHKDSQVYTDQINEKTANAGVTVDGLLIKDSTLQTANAVTALSQISGGVIQVVMSSDLGAITFSDMNVEHFWGEVAITPKRTDSTIYAFLVGNGIDNGGNGRLSLILKHDTTSGGTTGTQIGRAEIAQDSTSVSGLSSAFLLGKVTPGSTTTRYLKAIVIKQDASTTWYCGRYGSNSYILLVEVRA